MTQELFVGNLDYNIDNAQLKKIFQEAGEVQRVEVIADRESGRSKGFGFVEMKEEQGVQAALKKLNQKEIAGRKLAVEPSKSPKKNGLEADPKPPARPRILPGPNDLR